MGRWGSCKVGSLAVAIGLILSACQPERRELALGEPITPPTTPGDPRAKLFEDNFYQVSQGGRLFTWYGCGAWPCLLACRCSAGSPRYGEDDSV